MEGGVLVITVVAGYGAVANYDILHLALTRIIHKRREGDLLILPIARALLDDLPQKHEARQNKYPEEYRFDRRIHEITLFLSRHRGDSRR
jgi:hypothetical protein